MYQYTKLIRRILFLVIIFPITSCSKLLEVDPPINSEIGSEIYKDNSSATAVLTGLYSRMGAELFDGVFTGRRSISITAGLLADELNLVPDGGAQFNLPNLYRNSVSAADPSYGGWRMYDAIYTTNAAIEGIAASTSLNLAVKNQLIGESKFIRAFCYTYLVNLYGAVPLVLNTDYKVNSELPRSSVEIVYEQIINDLKEAQILLNPDYLNADLYKYTSGIAERVRPTSWAASALLARVYLYTGQWEKAEEEASKVIENTSVFNLENDLNNVFLKNSSEAIWQIQPTVANQNTKDGLVFVLPAEGPNPNSKPVYLSYFLLDSFETNDARRTSWVDSVVVGGTIYHFPVKYKIGTIGDPPTEYLMVLRLGEQYLIRAEARIRQNRLTGSNSAEADINVIRARAGLPPTNAASFSDFVQAILHERKIELFTEWGHRWLDLKRFGVIDEVMNVVAPVKGGTWADYKQLLPIFQGTIKLNPNLSPNNPGY